MKNKKSLIFLSLLLIFLMLFSPFIFAGSPVTLIEKEVSSINSQPLKK